MKLFRILVALFFMASATGLAQSDTIYYFDCADSIPGNWQSLDSTGNNFSWEHTYVGLDAAYCPLSSSSFNSTSANNGWLMLHSAYHNTDSTGGTLEPLLEKLEEMGVILKDVVIAIEKGEGRERLNRERPEWPVRSLARIDIIDGKVDILE